MPTPWEPDWRNLVDAAENRRPRRLPLYEHAIDPPVIEAVLGQPVQSLIESTDPADTDEGFRRLCGFYRRMTYDTVSYEAGLVPILPGHGAIYGGKPGPIQSRADFDRYPWADIPRLYREAYDRRFRALGAALPSGMKSVGGVGYGVFEMAEDLVGYEWLCLLMADDPDLAGDLFVRIGDTLETVWRETLARHGDAFAVCRMGDDLGFKSSTLLSPDQLRRHVIPQHARVVRTATAAGKPFLLHSCGAIFEVMEDLIATGISAKHSNEDAILSFDEWQARYGDRIALFGGVDLNTLCLLAPPAVTEKIVADGRRWRAHGRGFALGSGNSIAPYVPVEGYLAMIEAARRLRTEESGN